MVRSLYLVPLLALPLAGRVELVTASKAATIFVAGSAPECVRLAAADLSNDVRKITGRALRVVGDRSECGAPCIAVVSGASGLRSPEGYRVTETPDGLQIAGADARGAIFGIYALAEKYLGVDPLYFWSGREPRRRESLAWEKVRIESVVPTFEYRGWFINDEDLLTEWKDGGGARRIDYPYYHQVTHPDVLARVFEAALRLQYNLIIPASFTDISNPAEERMIQEATRRGLMVSMHHVEPMGVSAFGFANFWKAAGKDVPYVFHSQRWAFEHVWRQYAKKWSKYPGVVWQLGLRGIADRPAWHHDVTAPRTDEGRGAMISEAMQLQWDIVRSVDRRAHPPATTTLWMEGAELNRRGWLKIAEPVTIVFADNTPGWKMQADFHELPREAGRTYGIYYHQAVWGWGPHLVQGVPPWKTQEIFGQAIARRSSHYAVLNVSNVREFVLGLDASARMLGDFERFDAKVYLTQWCAERFGKAAAKAERAYRAFFDAYYVDAQTGTPALLDGSTLSLGKRYYRAVLNRLEGKPEPAKQAVSPENLSRFLPDMPNPESYPVSRLLSVLRRQRAAVEASAAEAPAILAQLSGSDREFFENNFLAQQQIFCGILAWAETAVLAWQASEPREHVLAGLKAFEQIRAGQALASRGTWKDWYRGDRKMNLRAAEDLTRQALGRLDRDQD